jgi:starch-binding outer membrane protein, SusD/RagB family
MNLLLRKILLLSIVIGALPSCNKKKLLDEKPDSQFVTPSTLQDFRALLDNERVMSETPVLGELSSDNYYLPSSFWQTLNTKEKNAYVWAKDVYNGEGGVGDWNKPYQQVFYVNIILDKLDELPASEKNTSEYRKILGTCLFIRAYAFHNLVQIFSPVYDDNLSSTEDSLGIPLREDPDINVVSERSSVRNSYDKIITYLKEAIYYLPAPIATELNKPSKPAAYALLARVYLSMRHYDEALLYADSCLGLHDNLLNYDAITGSPVFKVDNPELLYQSKMLTSTSIMRAQVVPACIVDSTLYASYDINDLRRSLFFTGNPAAPNPRVGYSVSIFMFSGLATDEVYLIKSECLARKDNFTEGLSVLNTFLQNRYKNGFFTPVIAANKEEALAKILEERRKELVFRGLRWTDLRRLNRDGQNITLIRRLSDGERILPANHANYVLPVPPDVPIKQNLRKEIQ